MWSHIILKPVGNARKSLDLQKVVITKSKNGLLQVKHYDKLISELLIIILHFDNNDAALCDWLQTIRICRRYKYQMAINIQIKINDMWKRPSLVMNFGDLSINLSGECNELVNVVLWNLAIEINTDDFENGLNMKIQTNK